MTGSGRLITSGVIVAKRRKKTLPLTLNLFWGKDQSLIKVKKKEIKGAGKELKKNKITLNLNTTFKLKHNFL